MSESSISTPTTTAMSLRLAWTRAGWWVQSSALMYSFIVVFLFLLPYLTTYHPTSPETGSPPPLPASLYRDKSLTHNLAPALRRVLAVVALLGDGWLEYK